MQKPQTHALKSTSKKPNPDNAKRTERVEDVPGTGRPLAQVAGDVDGNPVLAGRQAADVSLDGGGSAGGGLGQAQDAGHAGLPRYLARGRGGHGCWWWWWWWWWFG